MTFGPESWQLRPPARLPDIAPGHTIPRTIYQVFRSKNLPTILEANAHKIRALNPDWEYRLYDDKDMVDFVARNYGSKILSYYSRINPNYGASRADLFRYLLIYNSGGLYLDIKSTLEKPLRSVLRHDDVYVLSRWRNGEGELYEGWGIHDDLKSFGGEEFQQWHIAAAPGHPFLAAVITKVLQNIDCYDPHAHAVGRFGVLRLTGPIAYTRAISPLLQMHAHRIVDSETELGFKYSIFPGPYLQAHKSLFKRHYAALNEPVSRPSGPRTYWAVTRALVRQAVMRAGRLICRQ
jgi:hypothetical protein